MSNIVFYQFIIILISISPSKCQPKVNVTGQCGRPSVPPKAIIDKVDNNNDKVRFKNNEWLTILCSKDEFFVSRNWFQCKNGRWVGFYKMDKSRCAKSMHAQVTHLDIYDCGSNVKTTLVSVPVNQSAESVKGIRLSKNAFQRTRVPYGSIIGANGTQCYNYKLTFDQTIQFFYLALDLYAETNSTIIPDVTPFVSKYRTCQLAHKQAKPLTSWTTPLVFFTYYFICDLKSTTDYKIEQKELLDTITLDINTNFTEEIGLESVYLGQIFTNARKTNPECGKIQLENIGVDMQLSDFGFIYISCNESFVDLNLSDNITEYAQNGNPKHKFICDWNGVWAGNWPICVPIKTCSKDTFFYDKPDSVIIGEIGNVYYLTESQWFAINGSFVRYTCLNEKDRLVGKNLRTCLKDGNWSDKPPHCTSTEISGLAIAGILIAILILFVSIFLIAFRIHSKRVEKELEETRNEIQETIEKLQTDEYHAYNDQNEYSNYDYQGHNYAVGSVEYADCQTMNLNESNPESHQYLDILRPIQI